MRDTETKRTIATICRVFVGLVFIFSGFVKGVDPMGTSYKIVDYMNAWTLFGQSFAWATPCATVLAVLLIVTEFTVGILLITGSFKKFTSWILLLMMLFFTCTTLYDAITNKVSDCGCFGDFVKLTNWQTFWKNIILLVPTVYIFLCRKFKYRLHFERDLLIALLAIIAMVVLDIWTIRNEPLLDFRPWKVGNEMMPLSNDNLEVKSYLKYRNKETGSVKEFESKELMKFIAADSTWMTKWEFVDSRVEDPYEIKAEGFSMLGPDGEDYAKDIIGDANYVMVATIHSLNKIDDEGIRALRLAHDYCVEKGINFVLLTSAVDEDVQLFLYENKLDEVVYYFADATAIKAMMRSNPGFILLKDAVVLKKWPFRKANDIQNYPFEIE